MRSRAYLNWANKIWSHKGVNWEIMLTLLYRHAQRALWKNVLVIWSCFLVTNDIWRSRTQLQSNAGLTTGSRARHIVQPSKTHCSAPLPNIKLHDAESRTLTHAMLNWNQEWNNTNWNCRWTQLPVYTYWIIDEWIKMWKRFSFIVDDCMTITGNNNLF